MEIKGYQITLSPEELERETQELVALVSVANPQETERIEASPELIEILVELTPLIKDRFLRSQPLFPVLRQYNERLKAYGCSFNMKWLGSLELEGSDQASFLNPAKYSSTRGRIAIPPVVNENGQVLMGALAIYLPSHGHPHENEIFSQW